MKIAVMDTFLQNKKASYTFSIGIVVLFYIVGYFIFLCNTHFLPYVFDNNETFSSLIHAQNLFHFGIEETFGLTDEAYGLLKTAHPYVYTHQGNFPRLYSFLLYSLGIKSAEWQIFVTTFTIGLAGIVLCQHYFSKYVSPLFSVIFCLLLMTDYVMFVQWHINTWRVWHLFFFFSSFLCCHGLISKKSKYFIVPSILNFACLFYMEIVYAAFVFFSTAIYLLIFPNILLRTKLISLLIICLGALVGVGVLVEQNIVYLGWDNFLQDLSYTFTARNQLLDSDATSKITKFYAHNKIVFWDNFNSYQQIRNPILVIKNFYRYCLLPYSPLLTLAAFLAVLGSGLSYVLLQLQRNKKFVFFTVHSVSNWVRNLLVLTSCLGSILFLPYISLPSTWDYRFSHVSLLTIIFGILILIPVSSYLYLRHRKNNAVVSYIESMLTSKKLLVYVVILSIFLNLIFLSFNIHPSIINNNLLYRALITFALFAVILGIGVYYFNLRIKPNSRIYIVIKSILISKYMLPFISTFTFLLCLIYLTFASYPITWDIPQISQAFRNPHLVGYALVLVAIFLIHTIRFVIHRQKDPNLSFNSLFLATYFMLAVLISYLMYYLDRFCGFIASFIQEQSISALGGPAQVLLIIGALLFVSSPLLHSSQRIDNDNELNSFRKLLPFFIATFTGFIGVYLIFPGYVRTGYWLRYCCFTVFAHMTLYAWLFYSVSTKVLTIFQFDNLQNGTSAPKLPIGAYLRAGVSLLILLIFTYLWLHIQWFYIKEFPPGDFNFVKLLKSKPFHNKPIVSNTYAAPFSYDSQAWAYSDPVFAQSNLMPEAITNHYHVHFQRDLRYMWFADAANNIRYKNQVYFVCWQSSYSLDLLGHPKPKCSDFPLVQFVRSQVGHDLGLIEVEHDQSGRDKWSIIALTNVPYNKKNQELQLSLWQKVCQKQSNISYLPES